MKRRAGIALQVAIMALALFSGVAARAQAVGSISGTVRDPDGSVVPDLAVIAKNTATGVQQNAVSNAQGFYAFTTLPVGTYEIDTFRPGFKPYQRTNLVIDINTALQIDITLEVGEQTETVTVSDTGVHVETESSQMGETLASEKITEVPLNGRAFTDLLNLQPGVVPISTGSQNQIVMAGLTNTPPSGDANPGNQSINGQKENANGFNVNGSNVEEAVNMGVAVLPNLDSISEFRILTNNFDAQYGNYSGGQIIVATKSGTNAIHGDAFEFLRNTALDAKPFFSAQRGAFEQNQFGGTLGGPIKHDKIFWFADYQGTRTTQGQDTGVQSVPSASERQGDFSDDPGVFTTTQTLNNQTFTVPTSVSTSYLASTILSPELGESVSAGEPYYFSQGEHVLNNPDPNATYPQNCTSSAQCVFPNAAFPSAWSHNQSQWSAPAKFLLPYIPSPNIGASEFDSSALTQTVRDDKGAVRLDADTRFGNLFVYYFGDNYFLDNPYPIAQGGANVPSGKGGAFNALSNGFAQLIDLGDAKTFGTSTVNEFHFSYMRYANNIGQPTGGVGTPLACQGFVTAVNESAKCPSGPASSPEGIYPLAPSIEGIENVALENMGITIGTDITNAIQRQNTFHFVDDLSRVIGTHTMKFGAEFHFDQVDEIPNATFNGSFQFNGSETGSDYADFLIGVASVYVQSDQGSYYPRNKYAGFFAQDSWRVKPSLTLNYGLRWDIISPWYEKYNQVETFVPGRQSVVFPGAPTGYLVPGDPGVPRTLSPIDYKNLAPRVGVVYAPSFQNGILKRIVGNSGNTSIRAGFGMFYTAIPGLTAAIMYGTAPYGYNYVPNSVLFAEPGVSTNGTLTPSPVPIAVPPFGASASNPNKNVNWAGVEPVSADPAYANNNRVPYSEQWNLSIERQFKASTLLSVSYVGNEGHRLLAITPFNSANPQACLTLNVQSPGSCGPSNDNQTRPLYPAFAGDSLQETVGNSNYNAMEVNLRHTGAHQSFLLGYTWGKSFDDASSIGEEVLPGNLHYTYALSSFDMARNFVASYKYDLPVDTLLRRRDRLTSGWSITGITRFATGFPVTLSDQNDDSLLGSNPNGVNNNYIDLPSCAAGALDINNNGRNGQPAFNTALFSRPALGTLGTCPRRFFYGPGINNWDLTLQKDTTIREGKTLQIRVEMFNAFNHTQFYGNPTTGAPAVNGSIGSPAFGMIENAAPPRIVQLGAKFSF